MKINAMVMIVTINILLLFYFLFLHFLISISYFLISSFLISHFLISHSLFYNNPFTRVCCYFKQCASCLDGCVIRCQQPLSGALYTSSCTLQGFVATLNSVCACVLALVLGWMCHPVPAACKDVSSSVRWPLYKLMYCLLHSVCACVLALVLGWMLPAACKDVSSSVRWPLYKLMQGLLLL